MAFELQLRIEFESIGVQLIIVVAWAKVSAAAKFSAIDCGSSEIGKKKVRHIVNSVS